MSIAVEVSLVVRFQGLAIENGELMCILCSVLIDCCYVHVSCFFVLIDCCYVHVSCFFVLIDCCYVHVSCFLY